MEASGREHFDVVNRLLDWQQTQIRAGFEILRSHGSLDFPVDLIGLIVDFAV